jgi:threonyl-tRNA synthetase
MNSKIREHALQKVPFQIVVGDKEAEAGEVNVRVRGQEKAEGSVKTEAFVGRVKGLIESKSPTLELAPDWKKLRDAAADSDLTKD